MTDTIEIKDVGPVDRVRIPVPEDGGVVVLRGRNGSGKTKTLQAVEAAATGRGGLTVRDGQLRGSVDAFGVSLRVGRATRRTGELEVETLDGRFNVADVVDPGLKSHEAADAKRIKALVQVAGVKADPALFYQLVGGKQEFTAVVSGAAVETDDLIVMADRIKRDLEGAARKEEDQARHAHAASEAARSAAEGVDVTAEDDSQVLQQRLEQAVAQRASLESQAETATKRHEEAERAAERLRVLSSDYAGPSVEKARQDELAAQQEVQTAREIVQLVEAQLREVKQDLRDAESKAKWANQTRAAAEEHEELIAECKAIAQGDLPQPVSTERLEQAAAGVSQARSAVEQGAVVRRAKQQVADAERCAAEAAAHAERSQRLRDAARSTDEVLSSVVAKTGTALRVEAGRLVLDTRRGATYFSELSHGERWRIALDVAIEAVGQRGVLVIPQEAWEGLDPDNRAAIAEHVRGRGAVVLTAEASNGDAVSAEVYR